MENSNSVGKIVGTLLVGTAIGALLGVLFAPKKGKNLRNDIVDKSNDFSNHFKKKTMKQAKKIKDKMINEAKNLKEKIIDVEELVEEKLENAASDLKMKANSFLDSNLNKSSK